jgi:arabinan endo-1,5-alpha-L-arabinosidase
MATQKYSWMWSVVVVAAWCCPQAQAQVGAIDRVHDPAIIAADGAYYLFCTSRGIPIRRSIDLYSWDQIGMVFPDGSPAWAREAIPGSRGLWAPHISFFHGRYYLYYSASTFGSQRSAIGVAVTTTLDPADPKYRWEDQGMVLDSSPDRTPFNAIDPAAFEDKDKRVWLAWGSFWEGIYMSELDPATGKRKSADSPILHLAQRKGNTAIEAPYLIEHDGKYYLFVSFDTCCKGVDSTYRIMVGRADKVTGPYVDDQGKAMLEGGAMQVLAGQERWRGPGHNSILQTASGDFLVHHTYDAERKGIAVLQIRPIAWDNGWPKAGEPIQKGIDIPGTTKPKESEK